MRSSSLAPSALLLALLAGGCVSTSPPEVEPLGFVVPELLDAATHARSARRLQDLLVSLRDQGGVIAERQRFWAAFLLADLHARAADAPFLDEPGVAGRRPSRSAHLVVSVEHARLAADLLAHRTDDAVPAEVAQLAPAGLDGAREALEVLLAVGLSRLGFESELERLLARRPDLRDPDRAAETLGNIGVRPELAVELLSNASRLLRARDEPAAYRFAILAIEGEERFGHALPAAEAKELETWILSGASVRFLCPRSQTEYVPGQKKSPVSGIPHYEYEPVER